jgi:hypothetical protein
MDLGSVEALGKGGYQAPSQRRENCLPLDPPARRGQHDHTLDTAVVGERRQPIFVGSVSPSGHSIGGHSSARGSTSP